MRIERIADGDARVDAYRHVGDGAVLRSQGLFVAESRLVVRRVLEADRFRVRSILVNPAALRELDDVLGRVSASTPVYVCESDDFLRLTGFNIHRGCLALVERPPAPSVDEVMASARRIVVLEDVGNPDNVGGVFRNAAALGADAVILSPSCADPLYRKAIRTSMAATLRVPFASADDWPADLQRIRAAGFTVVALTLREPSAALQEFASHPLPSRIALVAGHEGEGLSTAVEASADHRVKIPIAEGVDSLNVAVAVGIALYAVGAWDRHH